MYQNTVWVLADPQSTTLTLVARPVGAGVSDTLPLVVKVCVRTAHRHDRSTGELRANGESYAGATAEGAVRPGQCCHQL